MKKRYVQVGVGGRARFFYESIASTYSETSEIVGVCDISQTRMDFVNKKLTQTYDYEKPVPTYFENQFTDMLDELKPDAVIVTSVDRTHDHYIITSMEKGYDVITEKPMTIDAEKTQAILDCQEKTGQKLTVTFNYRYAPHNSKVKELVSSGVIGNVHSIHFEWLLNTKHGADYFRRWHRNKLNSGGLLVHKSTHHFDLVNFWINSTPKEVFAYGDLNFYGRANADKRGVKSRYPRYYESGHIEDDPFAIDLTSTEELRELYLNAEADSGYIRDRNVFSDEISIEDTLGALVKYNRGTILTYSLNAYMPWEGFNVVLNGDKGRIELKVVENSYINSGGKKENEGALEDFSLMVFPLFEEPYEVPIKMQAGGHGGGDPALLEDIFGEPKEDPLNRAAGHIDGALSILTGIAANKSIASGRPIQIKDLVDIKNK
jgi:predicted dehydrogenase